jgi:hypothetical protein
VMFIRDRRRSTRAVTPASISARPLNEEMKSASLVTQDSGAFSAAMA